MQEKECGTHAKDVLNSFAQMKNEEKYCDFTLVIGDEEISVHQMVLAASSKYFDAMFSHDMAEKKTSRAEILKIEPSVGKQCIEYAYTGKIKFSRENPQDLIHAAEMMQLHSLIDLYFNFLMEEISAENCLKYMELAQTYNKENFAEVFGKFLTENFVKFIDTEAFASMTELLLHQCLESLSDGSQNTEKIKWLAITKWTKVDLDRKDSFPKLLKLLSLENLPTQFLKEKVWKESLVEESSELRDIIFAALCERDQRPVKTASAADLGEAPTHILALVRESRLLYKYDLKMEKWSRFLRVPSSGGHFDIVSLESDIYVGNGASLIRYRDATWTRLFHSGDRSCYCRCVFSGSDIFMVTNNRVVQYDTEVDTCTEIHSCCNLGEGFATVATNNFVYAIGGTGTENQAREFDFATKTWEALSCMNHRRICGSLIFFQGRIIALGGYYQYSRYHNGCVNSDVTEYYDSMLDKWFALPNKKTNKCSAYNFKTFVAENKLYMVGENFEIKELKLEFENTNQNTTYSVEFCTARLG